MSRFVADTLELQSVGAYWFEIVEGGLDARPPVRGSNVTIPGKPGQTFMPKVADPMPVTLHGTVYGSTGTPYLERMDDLHTALPIGEEVVLTVHPDASGVGGKVPSGMTATITVEVLRYVGIPARGDQVRELSVECLCLSDPPEWVIGT
jgi:hypothetical protein